MKNNLNRRDFIKLLSLLPSALYLPPDTQQKPPAQTADIPNFIVLVFDTWSAKNIGLLGYPRDTTPNLNRLTEKAIVYHSHYAGGHFTPPGTATLLTGVHPWHHLHYRNSSSLDPAYFHQNIFGALPHYHRLAYTHNPLANEILIDMAEELDTLKPIEDLFINEDFIAKFFRNDYDIASVSWIRTMENFERNYANSLFFSQFWSAYTARIEEKQADQFPLGLPKISMTAPFKIEDAVDWLTTSTKFASSPFLSYVHLLPPHYPYHTRKEFIGRFKKDGYSPIKKPEDFLTANIDHKTNLQSRREYDEYILYVDSEIGRLFSALENTLQNKNTWVVLTSDHGEIFERGLIRHKNPSMYDPLVNIPLLIFPPNQQERIDVTQPTSAIDILPTLLSIAGEETPQWVEGTALPPFNTNYPTDQPIYIVDAKFSDPYQPYTSASLMLRRDNYKLIHHFGDEEYYLNLENGTQTELYNLAEDPEEMQNLFGPDHPVGAAMLAELNAKLASLGLLK